MPRLGDPQFEKLVTTEAWLQLDRTAFEMRPVEARAL